jgi:hypothetical protein
VFKTNYAIQSSIIKPFTVSRRLMKTRREKIQDFLTKRGDYVGLQEIYQALKATSSNDQVAVRLLITDGVKKKQFIRSKSLKGYYKSGKK